MIELVQGDITKVEQIDAIVNAANSSLLGGGGVDGAINKAAGEELLFECRLLGGCKTGQAKITKAYKLPCKRIIHTVGPVWNGGSHNEDQLLADCYINSLKLAAENQIRTIAFPSISTGIYSFPVARAAKIAVHTVDRFLKDHPECFDRVLWVLFDKNTKEAYQTEVDLIEKNLDLADSVTESRQTDIQMCACFFQSVIEQDRSAVVICNLEHEIIYMNPSAIENYRKWGGRELLGQSLLNCHNQQSRDKIEKVIEWFKTSKEHNMVYTFYNQKQNKDVYMVALRDQDRLIGYYEKHEYRNAETMKFYDLW